MSGGWKFYYVHADGYVTEDVKEVQGKCIGVIEARSFNEAEQKARELFLI